MEATVACGQKHKKSIFTYQVWAGNEAGESSYSAVQTVRARLEALCNIRVQATAITVIVSFDPVDGADSFDISMNGQIYNTRDLRIVIKDLTIKRGLNPYPYCDYDPVDYTDPTGESLNILGGVAIGGLLGGVSGFVDSAISQVTGGQKFNLRRLRERRQTVRLWVRQEGPWPTAEWEYRWHLQQILRREPW